MSNYYEYRDVKVMIAHMLMKMEGWKVYGYKADESDMMTDYWSPANWDGIAEKNGYILCVNVHDAADKKEICKYNNDGSAYDRKVVEKINKLKEMTVKRGASEAEAESAKKMIARLQEKHEQSAEKYIVTDIIPAHMANPPRMNWHIEKDGVYVAKGNGILKYSRVSSYFEYPHYKEDMDAFRKDKKAYEKEYAEDGYLRGSFSTMEKAKEAAKNHVEDMEAYLKVIKQFEQFINKIDTTCGGMLGKGDGVVYEEVTITEYKKENKVVEDTNGSLKEGQCFVLKTTFNYGCRKGLVYRIHAIDESGTSFYAYKLNGKLTKECTGRASSNNYWYIGTKESNNLMKWIEKGAISWCHIEEVRTPYEVKKVVKKVLKDESTETSETAGATETTTDGYSYEVSEDIDTRDNSKIYIVKIKEKLSREEYLSVNQQMKSIGGYYSRFKHGFLFKDDPTEKLNKNNN